MSAFFVSRYILSNGSKRQSRVKIIAAQLFCHASRDLAGHQGIIKSANLSGLSHWHTIRYYKVCKAMIKK